MSVVLREPAPSAPADGCPRGFYAVEPVGFVCGDHKVTTDANHPVVEALRQHVRAKTGAFPFHYGLSLGAPMYNKLPDERTHREVMMRYPKPRALGSWAEFFEDLVDPEVVLPKTQVPAFLRDGAPSPNATHGFVRRALPHGSMLAFSEAFEHGGRLWLLADDLSVVPADRVRVYRRTSFRGEAIGENLWPPFGWICGGDHHRYQLGPEGMRATHDVWPARTLLRLSEQTHRVGKHRYRQLRDRSGWVRDDHVCEVKLASKLPERLSSSGRWIYLSTIERTLVAYEGLRPVYGTMHAPGRGGVHWGKGDVRNYTTPMGGFHINWKERFATFSPDPGAPTTFWISNVMFVQFFEQPYALHGAYWHERFGIPTSAGCPNLSPYDAERLFAFTEPALPEGWQGVAPARGERGTLVMVGP